jgi:hypothetical protein
MNRLVETLYYAAIDADNAFTIALIARYGNNAADMRYQTQTWDAEVWRHADIARKANDAYHAAVQTMRKGKSQQEVSL